MTERLSRSRGASSWRLRIYDALYEASLEGRSLTRDELITQCERRFNRSQTMRWWESLCNDKAELDCKDLDYREIVGKKVRITLIPMRSKAEVLNKGTRTHPLYSKGENAPKYWHPKVYRPGRFREYAPSGTDPEARRAVRRMATGWPAEVRAELAKPKPRSDRLKELLAEGLEIWT